MLYYALLLLIGCKPEAELTADQKCAAAIQAMDADGDLFVPDGALPADCDVSWEDALGLLAEDGYQAGDCDDSDPGVNPGAEDVCGDDIDQDCDGQQPAFATRYLDDDGDGYGDAATAADTCGAPSGTVENGDDCDDLNPDVNPDGVETACADDVDSDCDGVLDCAIVGALTPEDWGALGVTESLGSGAGRAMDSDAAGRVLVGGGNGAWLFTSDEQRDLDVEVISIEGSVEAGADVCLLDDVDEDGETEIVVGDPAYSGDAGRVSLGYSGGDNGSLVSASATLPIGRGVETGDGLVVVEQFLIASWQLYFIESSELPQEGASGEITTFADTTLNAPGSKEAPPALSIATLAGGWLVAVGQPEDDDGKERAVVRTVTGSSTEKACVVSESADGTTLGTSILLADVTGDGAVDLLVGDPAEKRVYIYADAASCSGTLETADADITLQGGAASGFGGALSLVPDVNGDRIDDLLVGGEDAAVLFLGGADALVKYATLTGAGGFGASVAGADLDHDGFGDLIIGAPDSGGVTVLWGGPPA